jgi:hypothetical protein
LEAKPKIAFLDKSQPFGRTKFISFNFFKKETKLVGAKNGHF